MSGVQLGEFSDDGSHEDPVVSPDGFPGGSIDAGLLAARVAHLESEVLNLEAALQSRTRIGIAIGLLAERHDTTSERAWSLLTRMSNHTNHKVAEVARLLVAVNDGTLDAADVTAVGELARAVPRAVAGLEGDGGSQRRRRRGSASRPRTVAGPAPAPAPRAAVPVPPPVAVAPTPAPPAAPVDEVQPDEVAEPDGAA